MKIITFTLCFLPCLVFGQNGSFFHGSYDLEMMSSISHRNPLEYEFKILESVEGTSVKKVIKKSIYNQGKKEYASTYSFNDKNKITEIALSKRLITIEYINDTLLSSINSKGKKITTTQYHYVDGKLVLTESFEKNQLTARTTTQYDETGQILFSSVIRPKKKKNYSMFYTYEDGKMIKQRYMRNDVVVQIWDYSCKPEGEIVQSKVISNICRYREESNDGSYIEYRREEIDGKAYLNKHYFNSDSVNYLSESFVNEDRLISRTEKNGNTSKYTRYNSKGKIIRISETTRNDQGKLIESKHSWKGKVKNQITRTYVYNEDELLTEEKIVRRKKTTRHTTYEYVM